MLISHPEEKNVPKKSLRDHLFNVAGNCRRQLQNMRLNLTVINSDRLAELSFLIGISHDFGKTTSFFQSYIRKKRKGDPLTQHSFFSAIIAYNMVCLKRFEKIWAIVAYLIIKRHHGDLESLNENHRLKDNLRIADLQLEDILNKQLKEVILVYEGFFPEFSDFIQDIDISEFEDEIEDFEDILIEYLDGLDSDQRIEFFFIVNLLFSLLIDNDKKDAARLDLSYFDGNLEEPENDVFAFIDYLKKQEPEKFNSDLTLNKLRNQFLNEIRNNEHISAQQHFYTITAPTGIGKTFGCLAFANQLKSKLPKGEGRIIYCLPYTSIIDQNHEEFENIIKFSKGEKYTQRPERYLLKHHYLSSKTLKNRKDEENYSYKDYLEDRLLIEAWESSLIVTTFVQFFHTIIGYKNRFLKKFHNIVNSIVILDEVQNIPPEYHNLLKYIFHVIGTRFNIYFLLITATQPEILDQEKSVPVSLVQSDFYMKDPSFNRIKLWVDNEEQTLEKFGEKFCQNFSGDNCLIVLNTKKSAISLYNHISKQLPDYYVYCLTTLLVPRDRKTKIKQIKEDLKENKKVIVVSTQLIEAGVDLSFRFVYRDFGPLDSIVQVAGRCNRNGEYGELGGEMYLVTLQDDNRNMEFYKYIYDPVLIQYVNNTLEPKGYQSKDFTDLSINYFNKFDFEDKSNKLLSAIYELNYDIPGIRNQIPIRNFKLIEEYNEETLYILTTIESEEKFNRFLLLRELLQDKELSDEKKESILLEIEFLKTELKEFQISVKTSDLDCYKDSIIQEKDNYKYITYEDQQKYAYTSETGFLLSPKEEIDSTLSF